jgi:acyl-coenzyme A thioesterase PaaI-like protein
LVVDAFVHADAGSIRCAAPTGNAFPKKSPPNEAARLAKPSGANRRFIRAHPRRTAAGIDFAGGKNMTDLSSLPNAAPTLDHTRQEAHPFCFVCSASNPMGLALRYTAAPDGSVSATFLGNPALEGYAGLLHGGVVAALADGAMTNCLFAQGIQALTAALHVRYRSPVLATEALTVRAWRVSERHGMYTLRAEIQQAGHVKAQALGKFLRSHE